MHGSVHGWRMAWCMLRVGGSGVGGSMILGYKLGVGEGLDGDGEEVDGVVSGCENVNFFFCSTLLLLPRLKGSACTFPACPPNIALFEINILLLVGENELYAEKKLFNKLWLLLDLRAELDLRSLLNLCHCPIPFNPNS